MSDENITSAQVTLSKWSFILWQLQFSLICTVSKVCCRVISSGDLDMSGSFAHSLTRFVDTALHHPRADTDVESLYYVDIDLGYEWSWSWAAKLASSTASVSGLVSITSQRCVICAHTRTISYILSLGWLAQLSATALATQVRCSPVKTSNLRNKKTRKLLSRSPGLCTAREPKRLIRVTFPSVVLSKIAPQVSITKVTAVAKTWVVF